MKFSIVGFGFMGEMHAQIYQALLDVEIATLVAIKIEGTKHKNSYPLVKRFRFLQRFQDF